MTARDVYRAVDTLKEMCDPRGHELLDAIGDTLISAIGAVEKLDAMFEIQQAAGRDMQMRPEDFLAENARWSRRVGA